MERRFRVRLDEWLNAAEVHPSLRRGSTPRLEAVLQPFVATLPTPERQPNARHYVQGRLADLDGKDIDSIAYLRDRERQGLQQVSGQAAWDHQPLLAELVRQLGTALGEPEGVWVFDPAAFPKQGAASGGVQRQWCGRLGQSDNGRVGLYLGYVSRHEPALVDGRLYLPKEWARRKRRRRKAGVPDAIRCRTRHELFLERLDERGPALPPAWVSGDDALGRCSWFRPQWRARNECSLLAVPSNTAVRELTAPEPPEGGRGRRPSVPFTRVDRWCAALPATAGQTVAVRDGAKGPVVVPGTWTPVQARTEGRVADVAEVLGVFRERQADGSWQHDYLLSHAALATPVNEFAGVFQAPPRIAACLQRAKGAAGLAAYHVRTRDGWHPHQTLSLLATWFLTQETRRGKNPDPGVNGAAGAGADRWLAEPGVGLPTAGADSPYNESSFEAQRSRTTLSLATTQPLTAATG